MNCFFDTNIILAYTFECDPFHDDSLNAFSKSNYICYSKNVKNEFDYKFRSFKNMLEKFFMDILFHFKYMVKSKNIKKSAIKNFIKDTYSSHEHLNKFKKSINLIWSKNSLKNNVKRSRILKILVNIIEEFGSKSNSRKEYFFENSKCTDLRRKEYNNIYNDLSSHPNSHREDVVIILDAHDWAIHFPRPLDFVTTDKNIPVYASVNEDLKINSFLHSSNL